MKNPASEESVQSSAFRTPHAVAHVSAIKLMDVLPGYRDTCIWGMYFGGIATDSKFQ